MFKMVNALREDSSTTIKEEIKKDTSTGPVFFT